MGLRAWGLVPHRAGVCRTKLQIEWLGQIRLGYLD